MWLIITCHFYSQQRSHEKGRHQNFTRNKLSIPGKERDMKCTFRSHYLVPVSKTYEALNDFDENNNNDFY